MISEPSDEELSFDVLDDVLLASVGLRSQLRDELRLLPIINIGPILELFHLQPKFPELLPQISELRRTEIVSAFIRFRETTATSNSLNPSTVEFIVPPINVFRDPYWIAFCKRLERAARNAGLDDGEALGIVGAFREMVDNAIIHSEAADSIIAAYAQRENSIEFAVADSGRGVLASLREHPDYAQVSDYGTALRLCLSDGESRFGRGSGHGNGFRTLFLSLAGMAGRLRFRSGDHALDMHGTDRNVATSNIMQRAPYAGFVVSVQCRSNS